MRKRGVLLGILLVTLPAYGNSSSGPFWTPDAATVARVDRTAMQFDLPQEFGRITTYARYYWGTVSKGRRVIEGMLVTPQVRGKDSGIVRVVTETEAPAYADGGCMFIHLTYDTEAGMMMEIGCNFDLRPPPPEH